MDDKLRHYKFPITIETKTEPDNFIFYRYPTNQTFSIRNKKGYINRDEGNSSTGIRELRNENEPVPIILKCICIEV